jgi:hypothetical protein
VAGGGWNEGSEEQGSGTVECEFADSRIREFADGMRFGFGSAGFNSRGSFMTGFNNGVLLRATCDSFALREGKVKSCRCKRVESGGAVKGRKPVGGH